MAETSLMRELDIKLERDSSVPLYHQLAKSIEQAIVSGALAPGDRLENELSMTNRLGLSRPTTRQGIQELVKKGLLVRKRGVGTQVVRSQFRRDERLSSLSEDLVRAGRTPSTVLLELSVGPLETEVRDALDAAEVTEGRFTKIRRLRRADGVPLAILTNYLPDRLEVTAADLEAHGLYAHLRSIGVHPKVAHQHISARMMTDDEATLFETATPAACLTVDRIAYDGYGQLVELGRHVYLAEHYSVHSTLTV